MHFLFRLSCSIKTLTDYRVDSVFILQFFSISETVSLARDLSNKSEATKQKCEPAAVYDCRKQGVIATARPSRLLLSQIARRSSSLLTEL